MPNCVWCGHVIMPSEKATKFRCPLCDEFLLWRCEKCRIFRRPYKCPKCGFQGP
ncbi:MAG: DUF1610 domain-containing protein [Candidatus Bathyarchaeota archaeon]|nr:MAG: DUF1610 domain-containing protein [Candidatus Bathyarchaeota archaeon]